MFVSRDIYIKNCNEQKIGHQLTDEEIRMLQTRLFRMYRDLEAVCKKHGLRMMLAYGNVIGVMRHGGWIPWDDDLDVHMPREDYDRLLNDYVDELPEQYRVYAPHTKWGPSYRFAKIIDTSTLFVPIESDRDSEFYPGVFIDIFPLENISTNKFVNTFKKAVSVMLSFTARSVEINKSFSKEYKTMMCATRAGRINYNIRNVWGFLTSFVSAPTWYRWIDKFNQHKKKTGYLHIPTDLTSFVWKPIPEDMFFPTREVPFEGENSVDVPGRTEDYLELVYGDWKTIPPADKIWHHYIKEIEIPQNP